MLTEHQVDMAAVIAGFDEDTAPAVIERFARAIEAAACAPLLERIAELEAKLAQRVPDGWQMVPAVPTHMMELRGSISWENSGLESPDVVEIYQAMLSAAPAAPEQQEPSSFGGKEMQDMIIARCIEKDSQAPNAQQAEAQPVAWSDFRACFCALSGLLEQVETFCSKHGEAEFETGEALAAVERCMKHDGQFGATPQPKAVPLTEAQIDEAAKVLSHCMDYPWAHMSEAGRVNMRKNAKMVIESAIGAPAKKGGE